MKIGIAFGGLARYGTKESIYVSDNNLKEICDILTLDHEVTILTRVLEVEKLPANIKVRDNSVTGKYDLILFGHCSSNLMNNNEMYRLLYVLNNFEYNRAFELVIDTDLKLMFEYTIKQDRIKKLLPVEEKFVGKRNFEWYNKIKGQKLEIEYQSIYNCSEGRELVFPFTLMDYNQIVQWKPEVHDKIISKNLYIGRCKDRTKLLKKLNIETDMYSNKLPGKCENITLKERIKIQDIRKISGQYMCTVISADKEHANTGWILRRIAESIVCNVPVLVHENVFGSKFGFTDVDNLWMKMSEEQINKALTTLKTNSLRFMALSSQKIFLKKVIEDFNLLKREKLNLCLQ